MMMDKYMLINLLKYIVISIILYVLFYFIGNEKLSHAEILFIIIIIMIILIIYDHFNTKNNKCDCDEDNELKYLEQNKIIVDNQIAKCNNNFIESNNENKIEKMISMDEKKISDVAKKIEHFNTGASLKNNNESITENEIMKDSDKKKRFNMLKKQKVQNIIKENNNIVQEDAEEEQQIKPTLKHPYQYTEMEEFKKKPYFVPPFTSHINKGDFITNELVYSDYHHVQVPDDYDTSLYEHGYTFLPPEKWYPQPPNPPVCVTNNRCPVCPLYTSGSPVDIKEWHSSRRVTPPDNINVKYINDKLNSGK